MNFNWAMVWVITFLVLLTIGNKNETVVEKQQKDIYDRIQTED